MVLSGRLSVLSIALLVILDSFGISITPILASLGVGSLAVALALQDTLSNFFSGVYLLIDEPVRLGDHIQLESGVEGRVAKIGFRSTQILLPGNNLVILPNSKLASSRITNFDLGEKQCSTSIECSISFSADLKRVELIAQEVALEVAKRNPQVIEAVAPLVRFVNISAAGVTLSVVLRVEDVAARAEVNHALILALVTRFNQEGIRFLTPASVFEIRPESREV